MGKPREQYKLPNESFVNVTHGWPWWSTETRSFQPLGTAQLSCWSVDTSRRIFRLHHQPCGHVNRARRTFAKTTTKQSCHTLDITIVVTVHVRYRRYRQAMKWGWKLHNRVTGHRKAWSRLQLIRHGRSWCRHHLAESTAGTDVTCKRQASPPSRPSMSSRVSSRVSQRWARLSCRRVCLRYLVDRTDVRSSLIVWSKCVRVNTTVYRVNTNLKS